jgi:hypothetical protein
VYNPATRRITTSVHVKFQESVTGFTTSHHVDSSIDVFLDVDDDSNAPGVPQHADMSPDDVDMVYTSHDLDRPTRVRGPPAHFEDYVANMSAEPRVCVT